MRVAFRVDSSEQIGSGHLMRCLALAARLRSRGHAVTFLCRSLAGHMIDRIRQDRFSVIVLTAPETAIENPMRFYEQWLGTSWEADAREVSAALKETSADWLIVDHYALDARWEKYLQRTVRNILVIDDLADRPHACSILLDQNLQLDATRYDIHLTRDCIRLLGPSFALLSESFEKAGPLAPERSDRIQHLLLFLGGSDLENHTERILNAFALWDAEPITLDVVVGSANPLREKIRGACAKIPFVTYHCQINNMPALMRRADLAIGAAGTSTWERCCVGLPAILLSIAVNQEPIGQAVHRYGAAIYLGKAREIQAERIVQAVQELSRDPQRLLTMSRLGRALVDGRGCARVTENLQDRVMA